MAKYNLNISNEDVDEILLNKAGDSVFVSGNDANLWDKFCQGLKKIENISYEANRKEKEIIEKYPDVDGEPNISKMAEEIKIRTEFCEKANTIIDDIFGAGTAVKIFRVHYETIQDFIPDEDKFMEFFYGIIPIMETIFHKKVERGELFNKKQMAKYQPQDHKRKGGK